MVLSLSIIRGKVRNSSERMGDVMVGSLARSTGLVVCFVVMMVVMALVSVCRCA